MVLMIAGLSRLPAGDDEDNSIHGIGPVDGKITKVKLRAVFGFSQGPTADHKGNVYFSDIPNERIYKINTKGKPFVFREKTNHANGLAVNARGNIIACEMDGRIVAISPDGEKLQVLANQYNGKRFNAPNELVIDKTGGIYFTDPEFKAPKPLPQGTTAVYYVAPDRKVTRLIDTLHNPHGICLSPDEKTLYVIPSGQPQMMAYPIKAPGKIANGRVFCTIEHPKDKKGLVGGDGAAVDAKGNLYIATALGVQVFSPQGEKLGLIKIPEQPSNVAFGGADFKTLYVTARTSLYAAAMEATGYHLEASEKQLR
jgi:gluconolactonase